MTLTPLVVTRERAIPASPEALWPRVSDPDRLAGWFGFAESIEVLDGLPGVGQRRRQHGRWGRKYSEVDQRIVTWDPPRGLAWVHEAERLDGRPAPRFAASTHLEIELVPGADGTTGVVVTSTQVPAGLLRGVVMRAFSRRELARTLDRSLEALAAPT